MELFKTERLCVCYLENNDLELFYDMQSNLNVMQFVKPPMNLEESKKELNRFIGYYHNPKINFNIWAVKEQHSNLFIGICGFYENSKKEIEIAYRLREQFWRKGYGREIARGLIQYCFEETTLEVLRAYVRAGNTGSIQILKQEMEYQYKLIQREEEEHIYELRKEDWLTKR